MLIKLKIDQSGEIIAHGWANPTQRKAGDTTADGFTIYDLADEESAKIVIGHSKLAGGTVTVDADYVAPAEPEPVAPQPSAQDQINATLLKQTAQNAAANAAIMKQLATITAAETTKGAE
ncbi:hypothetical protein [Lacticaseibacillus suibinensis]|uniref:hypothetical protein n=1 Tax=Lacticaseibacillus suibinensis TaxID=2486011 RepID=UPI000F76E838|nr:hypothetical protein [Lacticaseibacillus suibinensis]